MMENAFKSAAFYGKNRGKDILKVLFDEPFSAQFITPMLLAEMIAIAVAVRQMEAIQFLLLRREVQERICNCTLLRLARKIRGGLCAKGIQRAFQAEFDRRRMNCCFIIHGL
ncbi:hypothetical protein FJ364_05520 [Candidatus Dependentiae bacterium]|nr:hypothetical protein [Candidatus Dependentiae bacterium]